MTSHHRVNHVLFTNAYKRGGDLLVFCILKWNAATKTRNFLVAHDPLSLFRPLSPPQVAYIVGQLESGNDGGYLHWQIMVAFSKKMSLAQVILVFGNVHAELSRSSAAQSYCQKDDTRVEGTSFELGY